VVQGFNTDIKVNDTIYHIQTELVGKCIVSLIFRNGAVIADRRTNIVSDGKIPPTREELEALVLAMKSQHRNMIERLKSAGKIPQDAEAKKNGDTDLIRKFLDEWSEG
jgi:DNA-binding transcriptional regulator YhcF (GntR family)